MASKTVKVYEVLYHSDEPRHAYAGAAGDGSFIARFRKLSDAEAFARGKRCYAEDASVNAFDAPRRLAQRWGLA